MSTNRADRLRETDLAFDALSRDLVRLSEAYLIDDIGEAARINERMFVTLMELMESHAGVKIDFSGILNRAS